MAPRSLRPACRNLGRPRLSPEGSSAVANRRSPWEPDGVRYDDPLRAKLEQLTTATDPHFRGRAFEHVVAEIFDRAGFDVVTNPRAAHPRQTDVYASNHRNGYLIEAKWSKDRIGSAEIDNMRSRLGRQPSDVIGVIVTMGDVAEQAFAEIERDRSRVILIINQTEVENLIDANLDLRRLLDLKRRQLVVHGKASGASPAGFVSSVRDRRTALRFVAGDGSELPWITGTADYLDSCWALKIADIDWVSAGGAGVVLDLRVPADSLDALRKALGHLRALNWLGPDPSWTIQQNSRTWNAFGLDALLVALDSRDARYADLDRPHHREMLVLADVCHRRLVHVACRSRRRFRLGSESGPLDPTNRCTRRLWRDPAAP